MALVIRAVGGGDRVALGECAVVDITEMRKALGERTVLLAGLWDRVNDNLQPLNRFVLTLADRTAGREMRWSLEDLSARIHSIALVPGRPHGSGDHARVHIREFLDELLASLPQGARIRLVAELDDDVVPVSTALPVGPMAKEALLKAPMRASGDIPAPELCLRPRRSGGGQAGTRSEPCGATRVILPCPGR